MKTFLKTYARFLYPAVILVLSFGVYFTYYGSPQAMFWDENYHVASAQKHIDGVMYMEPHPPLGKMLMAVGEVLFGGNGNVDKSKLNETDYLNGDQAPPQMTYKGFRWPSVVMMAISVLFFYGILRCITQREWLAAAFTSLVIFDNALVIHSRAAMLEGIQMFFILAALYYFVRVATDHIHEGKKILLRHYAILGVLIGLSISVKVNGMILVLLFVMLYGVDQWQAIKQWQWLPLAQRLAVTVPSGVVPLLLVFFGVFYIHIGMGSTIMKDRTYKASPEYLAQIRAGNTWAPGTFMIGMRDNWKYMSEYADGVPRLDVCKSGENGSYAMNWPLGKKTISYRWDKNTVDGKTVVKYKYLTGNPVVWFSVLAGIILSSGLIIGRFIYGNAIKDERLFFWICAFTGLYLSYMIAILQIERVMYLYHYLVPLVFGAINLALIFNYVFRDEVIANNRHTIINASLFALLVIGVFAFFSPFTYGFGLTEDQFELRNWFSFWQLQVVR
ncbi:phospholipid carrier-dependent glycosyltransferase [Cellvibrio japonicus]|uniref:Polyprenol-phosphate-mannose--protein mannosyltransferase n=1 Tax=Cellvibrio japonicus (strain Ueda107) TaxID=498211 RepID=B3PDV3_CELJU|nr:phospholipid carrier-dependent glycosyltransferase [Cellvibrio japonicus]ACE85890.1 glycosyl transferase, putative, gt39A [Cellvibrio japonicus Ueda107]QEI13439.1 phospholipid carrier-dependent glycosyltransferase [Cellvibrio japonicus]QEI17013.1 phospholipid carrier-dependent glycosyltransferase [Cellvibrio japonicus]QEI20591.1 phospholipid carrier-dependent glycosyltransferase [Cellvibrio japonicus]